LNIKKLRKEYSNPPLHRDDLDASPLKSLANWLNEAYETEGLDANAMTLSTVGNSGHPTARIVLLKKIDESGLHFYTDYDSRKGRDLSENPYLALTFYWRNCQRQVCIEGYAKRLRREESESYFNGRPHLSQLSAAAFKQGTVLENRKKLEEGFENIESQYLDSTVSCPERWGGYQVTPHYIEFWQGQEMRRHDRIAYTRKEENRWEVLRLSP
jgi:pyridoxamine 5'-phosphate oxidase